MKTPLHISHPRRAGLTLIELFVILLCVVLLIALLQPNICLNSTMRRGRLTDSLSNAKQIALALRMYAGDHDGKFPFALSDGTKLAASDSSNRALEQVMPKYYISKKIFINKRSAWCANPAADTGPGDVNTLKRGQSDWLYVAGLKADANPAWPLIATATASATNLTYTNSYTAKGGLWGGTDAIVGFADGSARPFSGKEMDTTDKNRTFPKRPSNGASIFVPAPDWLSPDSVVLAPEE